MRFLCLALLLLLSCGRKGPPEWVEPSPPPAPTALRAALREDVVILNWDYPLGAAGAPADFIVTRSSSGGEFREIARVRERSYADRETAPAASRAYRVAARGARGGLMSGGSNTVELPRARGLKAPGKLSFTLKGARPVISWEYPDKGGLFNLYRGVQEGKRPLRPLNPKPLSLRRITDRPDFENAVYYTVRAVEPGGPMGVVIEGPPSPELRVAPEDYLPSRPRGIGAAMAGGEVLIYWDENPEPWVRGYRVYRETEPGEFAPIGLAQTPAFNDPSPLKGKRRYRISALGPSAEGPPSRPVAPAPAR